VKYRIIRLKSSRINLSTQLLGPPAASIPYYRVLSLQQHEEMLVEIIDFLGVARKGIV